MSREENGCVSDPCTPPLIAKVVQLLRIVVHLEASLDLRTNEIHCGAVDLPNAQPKTEGGIPFQDGEGVPGGDGRPRGGVCLQKFLSKYSEVIPTDDISSEMEEVGWLFNFLSSRDHRSPDESTTLRMDHIPHHATRHE